MNFKSHAMAIALFSSSCAMAEYQTWDVDYNADTLPDSVCISSPWTKHVQGSGIKVVTNDGGILTTNTTYNNNNHQDMVYYSQEIEADFNDKIVVEAGIRQNSYVGGTNYIGTYYGGTSLSVGTGQKEEGLIIGPGRIQLFSSQLAYYWEAGESSNDFHVYRIEAQGNDVKVYVDGELKIDGTGTFGSNWWQARSHVRFGEVTGYASASSDYDFVRYRIEKN